MCYIFVMCYIFTVGKNPLPVAVAAHYFSTACKAESLAFLYSAESGPEYDLIRRFLEGKCASRGVAARKIDSQDGAKIRTGVLDFLGELQPAFHLHFSGGTSAMAVHTMSALVMRVGRTDVTNSCLSLKTNQILDGEGRRIGPQDLRQAIQLTFEELINEGVSPFFAESFWP